jgi:hypothetical protein
MAFLLPTVLAESLSAVLRVKCLNIVPRTWDGSGNEVRICGIAIDSGCGAERRSRTLAIHAFLGQEA